MEKDQQLFNGEINNINLITIIATIDLLAQECNKNAEEHGFWNDETNLLDMISESVDPTDSSVVHTTKDIERFKKKIISLFNSEKIALEMSELAERLECLRKNPDKMDEHCSDFLNIEIEVADLIIRALDFAGRRKLRIGEAIIAKMKYNKSREFMHGKNF